MNNTTMTANINRIEALDELIDRLKAERQTLVDGITSEMDTMGVDQFEIDNKIIRWTLVKSEKLDTKKVREIIGKEIYASLCKTVTSHRFKISH